MANKTLPKKAKSGRTPKDRKGTVSWRPFLRSYDDSDLRVLAFATIDDAYTALDIVCKGDLRGMPFGIPGNNSLVVPNESVKWFSKAGLTFEESMLLMHDELTSEELNEMRKQSIY